MTVQKNYRLDDFEVSYIKEFAQKNSCTETKALKRIIAEHSNSNENTATSFLINAIADGLEERLGKILTRVRLGVNNADKNSQILIEMVNSIYAHNPDLFIVDRKQQATLDAELIVKKRIANFREKKLYKEGKHKN